MSKRLHGGHPVVSGLNEMTTALLAYPPPPPGRLMMFTAANIAVPSCNQAQDVVG